MRKVAVLCRDLNSYQYEIDALKQFPDVELIFSNAVGEDEEYIQKEIAAALGATLLLKLTPEHICGKKIKES